MGVSGRTFAIGDIHGDLAALRKLFGRLPKLVAEDTVVFLGDYIDRGPDSAGVVAWLRDFALTSRTKVVTLRGNHEDAWLQVVERGWPEFILPRGNGCFECYRSFRGEPIPDDAEMPSVEDIDGMVTGKFIPADVLTWMKSLPFFYEDDHAIYVHAGIKRNGGGFPHPRDVKPQRALLWLRDRDFFESYRGKLVVLLFYHSVRTVAEARKKGRPCLSRLRLLTTFQ